MTDYRQIVRQIEPEPWARFKARCASRAPDLDGLANMLRDIAAGRHDAGNLYIDDYVTGGLEEIRDDLRNSLAGVSRYADPADAPPEQRGPRPIILRLNRPPEPGDPPGANRYLLSVLLALEGHRPAAQRQPVCNEWVWSGNEGGRVFLKSNFLSGR